ncbi:MAG: prepilin-type N-terminal cleavage/methylation domain-containing protein [Phycisphaeraceae bacterium]|nr:prepilin-type N-terminal cleavage/methylation domain-containing protein [Phycisphaeraceae bacterium]
MKTPRKTRAFSLIELLIAIGIIGLLISLSLPALAKARLLARQTKGLANVRSVGMTFSQYAGQYRTYPFIQPGAPIQGPRGPVPVPEGMIGTQWINPNAMIITSDPFEMEWMWAGPVSRFVDPEQNYPIWVSPGLPQQLPQNDDLEAREQISLRLSNAFIAKPELFGENPKDDPKMIAPVKPEDVLSPSSKVMLFDAHVAYYTKRPAIVDSHYDAPAPMVFADGHGDAKDPVQAKESVPNIMRENRNVKLHSTKNGIKGQDY